MSTENRAPGAPGEGVSDDQLKLERYATLISFTNDADIPVKDLASQWKVQQQAVSSIIAGAKRSSLSGKLITFLGEHGYHIDELPLWWGVRGTSTDEKGASADKVDEIDVPPSETGGGSDETQVYTPSTPVYSQEVLGVQYSPPPPSTPPPSGDVPPSSTSPAGTSITPQQMQLLAQQGVIYDEGHKTWVKVIPQGRGQYVETVDPIASLRVLEAAMKSERERADMAEGIADDLLDTVKLQTQAILKKVALNPSVFQCYQYVSNVRDPATNKVLFSGDFGDYISWAVIFATRVFYGVEPMFQINLPSIYTSHKRRRSDAEYMAQATPPQMQAAPPMLNFE